MYPPLAAPQPQEGQVGQAVLSVPPAGWAETDKPGVDRRTLPHPAGSSHGSARAPCISPLMTTSNPADSPAHSTSHQLPCGEASPWVAIYLASRKSATTWTDQEL
jgi:hypothetical protein